MSAGEARSAAQTPHDAEWLEYDDDTRTAFEPAPPPPPDSKTPPKPRSSSASSAATTARRYVVLKETVKIQTYEVQATSRGAAIDAWFEGDGEQIETVHLPWTVRVELHHEEVESLG